MLGYTVVLEAEKEGGYVVSVPALPGCYTQGENGAEALNNAREAITAYVEELRARGEDVPVEVKPRRNTSNSRSLSTVRDSLKNPP